MRLIGLAVVLAVSLTVAPLPAGAQQTGKVPRIGYLVLSPLTERPSPERAAFVTGLRELGWVEGRTIAIEYRSAKWNPEMFDDLAEELVRMKVDVIVTAGGEAAPKAVRRASSTIPIAMAASSDAIGMGLIASLARPGGSVTGLSLMTPELGPKRLELLKEAAPKASRLAVLWNPTYGDAQIRATQAGRTSAEPRSSPWRCVTLTTSPARSQSSKRTGPTPSPFFLIRCRRGTASL